MVTIEDFNKLDVRAGRIVDVKLFPEAHKPAYKLTIDFGEKIGIKKSSAQLVGRYSSEDLINKMILAVINFPPRQIGPFISEVLTLGVPDEKGETILVVPEEDTLRGAKLY